MGYPVSLAYQSISSLCSPCHGWPASPSTGAGLEWFRHDGTGVQNPGLHALQRLDLPTCDIPDLHLDILLQRPLMAFHSPYVKGLASISHARLTGTVRGEVLQHVLSRHESLFLLGQSWDDRQVWRRHYLPILAAAAFRLWYPVKMRPTLLDHLSPAGDVMSLNALYDHHWRWNRDTPSPGCHFPPGTAAPTSWLEGNDMPFLEFDNSSREDSPSKWRWRRDAYSAPVLSADWDDLEGIAKLVSFAENPDSARAFAWLIRRAEEQRELP